MLRHVNHVFAQSGKAMLMISPNLVKNSLECDGDNVTERVWIEWVFVSILNSFLLNSNRLPQLNNAAGLYMKSRNEGTKEINRITISKSLNTCVYNWKSLDVDLNLDSTNVCGKKGNIKFEQIQRKAVIPSKFTIIIYIAYKNSFISFFWKIIFDMILHSFEKIILITLTSWISQWIRTKWAQLCSIGIARPINMVMKLLKMCQLFVPFQSPFHSIQMIIQFTVS